MLYKNWQLWIGMHILVKKEIKEFVFFVVF